MQGRHTLKPCCLAAAARAACRPLHPLELLRYLSEIVVSLVERLPKPDPLALQQLRSSASGSRLPAAAVLAQNSSAGSSSHAAVLAALDIATQPAPSSSDGAASSEAAEFDGSPRSLLALPGHSAGGTPSMGSSTETEAGQGVLGTRIAGQVEEGGAASERSPILAAEASAAADRAAGGDLGSGAAASPLDARSSSHSRDTGATAGSVEGSDAGLFSVPPAGGGSSGFTGRMVQQMAGLQAQMSRAMATLGSLRRVSPSAAPDAAEGHSPAGASLFEAANPEAAALLPQPASGKGQQGASEQPAATAQPAGSSVDGMALHVPTASQPGPDASGGSWQPPTADQLEILRALLGPGKLFEPAAGGLSSLSSIAPTARCCILNHLLTPCLFCALLCSFRACAGCEVLTQHDFEVLNPGQVFDNLPPMNLEDMLSTGCGASALGCGAAGGGTAKQSAGGGGAARGRDADRDSSAAAGSSQASAAKAGAGRGASVAVGSPSAAPASVATRQSAPALLAVPVPGELPAQLQVEWQRLVDEVTSLRQHREWADKRMGQLISRAR